MAIALVQSNFNDQMQTPLSTSTCQFTSNITLGNLIVVAINEGTVSTQAPVITSVTDNNSNTYHQVFNNDWFYYVPDTAALDHFGLFYAFNAGVMPNAMPTITVDLASSVAWDFNIVIMEFSGIQRSSDPLDQSTYYSSGSDADGSPFTSAQTTPATNGQPGSTITTIFADEVAIAFGGLAGGMSNQITIGADYTAVHTFNDVTQNYTVGYKILSSTGSPNADFTGPGNPCFASIATFSGIRGTGFAPRWIG